MSRIVSGNLKGKVVVTGDGTEIGHVEDVQLDPSSWRVTALVVEVRRSVLEKLEIDEPIIAGGKSLMLDPTRVIDIGDRIRIQGDLWDVGRMSFR